MQSNTVMTTIKKNIPLLPNHFETVGWILLVPGIILSFIRFYLNIKIGFLELKVFAIYSVYFDSKYFSFIQNNYTEEIAGALLLIGMMLIAFSKEKSEDENVMLIRLHSVFASLFIFLFLVLLSVLFVFGFAFLKILITEVFILPALYIIIFKLVYRKYSTGKDI